MKLNFWIGQSNMHQIRECIPDYPIHYVNLDIGLANLNCIFKSDQIG